MAYAFADIAFTPSVRHQQDQNGSGNYAKFLTDDRSGGDMLSDRERAFVEGCDGFYQATVSETGWPYVQFRGGPAGFLRAAGPKVITYADLRGNRQYISLGNLTKDDRVSLIIMNYARAERLKIWGRAAVEERPLDTETDWPDGAERRIRITVEAFDWNCPRHIPRRLTQEEFGSEMAELLAENQRLRNALVERQQRPD
ncbi:MAG: pyridoxamine 5'-phosphate oxidase family protein [Pseudomonadota bacterium]